MESLTPAGFPILDATQLPQELGYSMRESIRSDVAPALSDQANLLEQGYIIEDLRGRALRDQPAVAEHQQP
jgi:hypothetical protein